MDQNTATAAFILRLALGIMSLAHGLLKVFVFTLPGTVGFFEQVGFPGWTAYLVVAVEIVAGLLLIAGVAVGAGTGADNARRDLCAPGQRLVIQQPQWRLGVSCLPDCSGSRAGIAGARAIRTRSQGLQDGRK